MERVNAEFKNDRELSVIGLLSALWHKTMTTRYNRQQQAEKNDGEFTSWVLQQIQKSQLNARMHQVEMASISEGRVTEGRQLSLQHSVDLQHKTCTCRVYQDLVLPCQHALACILHIQRIPQHYIPDDLSVNTWRQTYTSNMRPIIFTSMPNNLNPEIRYRRDARGQRGPRDRTGPANQQQCSTCQTTGHNARTCRNPHM